MVQIAPATIEAAQQAQLAWKPFASVSLAQFGIESAWGHKVTGTFNYFGIKAAAGQPSTLCWTHEFIGGRYVAMQQPFANYASPTDAFEAHAQLLATHPVYAPFMQAVSRGDVHGACDALTGVYATAPKYGESLWMLIEGDNLTQYDLKATP